MAPVAFQNAPLGKVAHSPRTHTLLGVYVWVGVEGFKCIHLLINGIGACSLRMCPDWVWNIYRAEIDIRLFAQ